MEDYSPPIKYQLLLLKKMQETDISYDPPNLEPNEMEIVTSSLDFALSCSVKYDDLYIQ